MKRYHKAIYIMAVVALLAWAMSYYKPWEMLGRQRAFDPEWPYHDRTSGEYSSGYDGIDISRHQGKIRWNELKTNRHLKFIYAKATEGLYLEDPAYRRNIEEAHQHGFMVGAYHFMTKDSGHRQFANFRSVVKIEEQDIIPMVDMEDDGTLGWSRSKIQSALQDFIDDCKDAYGVAPIIYCSESYYKDYLSPEFDSYLLFIASYDHRPVLPGKAVYSLWQFSRHGRIPGIWEKVDLDRAHPDFDIDRLKLNHP